MALIPLTMNQANGTPAATARSLIWRACCGLVANSASSGSLLHEPGVISGQHPAGSAETPDQMVAHIIADRIRIPARL
jgi:hypothetical protein